MYYSEKYVGLLYIVIIGLIWVIAWMFCNMELEKKPQIGYKGKSVPEEWRMF